MKFYMEVQNGCLHNCTKKNSIRVHRKKFFFLCSKEKFKEFFFTNKKLWLCSVIFFLYCDAPAASDVLITGCGARGQVGVTSGTL